ncbi:hypothetical protein [Adlercreutzia mucosicola]|uniref:hypothetical protein n=1 Tax=Adlercreutzia mucosicola TaxID=580026 RepID=UPI002B2518D7|nr:hypothetical protein [Adlercreutzia mucosicola]MEB1813760.1 hypothetical protein [Adlercreutzia mucosicola]
MSKAIKPASFEDFLGAPVRLSGRKGARAAASGGEMPAPVARPSSERGEKCPSASSQKVKVGLTIDEGLIDAVDDYIYLARKQGRRLKKNDVYEAALRQFLKAEGVDIR